MGKTLRTRKGKGNKNYDLLVRGGFVRSLGNGLFSFLPLGMLVVKKLQRIIDEELQRLGGQEVQVPLTNPYDLWTRSGRSRLIDRELVRFTDRHGKELVLAPSHEEAMVELVRMSLHSYRDLPIFLYQYQLKFRDELKVGQGLSRAKEFLMKDGYSFHRSFTDLNNFFPRVFAAYTAIFKRCHVNVIPAESGVGYMGGDRAYEFLFPSPSGDNNLIYCEKCGYRANSEVGVGIKDYSVAPPRELRRVNTEGCMSIRSIAKKLDVEPADVVKCMVYRTMDGFVLAVVRGNCSVSIDKLSQVLRNPVIRLATMSEIADLGLVPANVSPLEDPGIPVVVDDAVANSSNLIMGGNAEGVHFAHVNFGRDFDCPLVEDITWARPGHRCRQCGEELLEKKVLELGNIFKLGDFYSRSMNLCFQNDAGNKVYPFMGSYGIGMGRLLLGIVEENSDERGIIWPEEIAPYHVYLMGIGKSHRVREAVEAFHAEYPRDILLDDRSESIGVKFKDADLLGIPYLVVVSAELLNEDRVEVFDRRSGAGTVVELSGLAAYLQIGEG